MHRRSKKRRCRHVETEHPTHPLLGVGESDEDGGVGELEDGADGVDGGDEDNAVGDEGEAVPHADEAVEQRVDVRHGRELLRGPVPDDPLECGAAGDGHYSLSRLRMERRGEIRRLESNLTAQSAEKEGRNLQWGDEEHEGEDVP